MSDQHSELEVMQQRRRLLDAVKPYTYLVEDKLLSLIRVCEYLNREAVPGAFVECGTYKGGSAAVLSRHLGADRHLWLFDSFEGMPETTARDGDAARDWIGKCVASVADVEEVMALVGAPRERCTIRKGWFADTFREGLPETVALLHCDCDWYESVSLALETFYPSMPAGACVVLDDFGFWEGCREAFYDFCARHGEKPLLERVERDQAYWIKGLAHNRTPIPDLVGTWEHAERDRRRLQAAVAELERVRRGAG